MKIYDISLTIQPQLPPWPGQPPTELERIRKLENGDNCNVSLLRMSVHSGTHIDAPYHFLAQGGTVETLSLEVLVGEAQVIHLPDDCMAVTATVLQAAGIQKDTRRLLIRTRNSIYWRDDPHTFHADFTGLTPDGAQYLVEQGIQLVGLDYLSIAPYKKSRPTHEILLNNGVLPLEGINLGEVPAGRYHLYCLPLKLGGADGAPARAILISEAAELSNAEVNDGN